jgi:alpha-glucosidase
VPPGRRLDRAEPPRDPGRTPMPWHGGDGGWCDPWLPLEDTSRNVEEQRADPASTLHFTRDLIAVRRRLPDLRTGRYEALDAPGDVWAWRRGERCAVAVNLGPKEELLDLDGRVELSTDRDREGERFAGRLAGGEGVVLTLDL